MSGGSYNYSYRTVEEFADQLSPPPRPVSDPRQWFADHMRLCALAMHDIEWVDSCDYGAGQENAAIRRVMEHSATALNTK
jgi:hypothetical protein